MTLNLQRLCAHLNMTADEAHHADGEALDRMLSAAKAHTAAQLGYAIDDPTEFPEGTPADVEQAVLMLASHWFDQREATTVVTMIPVPFGFDEIIRNHRRWTFG